MIIIHLVKLFLSIEVQPPDGDGVSDPDSVAEALLRIYFPSVTREVGARGKEEQRDGWRESGDGEVKTRVLT